MSIKSSRSVDASAVIPTAAQPLVTALCIGMSGRIASRFLVLLVGALLVGGRRTVTRVLWAASALAVGHFSSFHRVFSRARWSMVPMARILATHAVRLLPADEPIEVAMDDTVTRHRGPRIHGRGLHRDAARSTLQRNLRCHGHRWVVLAILTKLPMVSRRWALPVLCDLHLTRAEAERQQRRFRSPCETARLLALLLFRWFPGRRIVFLGDGGYASLHLAKSIVRWGGTLVSRFHPDAALYADPPKSAVRRRGRPRIRGQRLPSPEETVATERGRRVTVHSCGCARRDVIVFTGVALWYRSDTGALRVRWVLLRDPEGRRRDDWLYSTDTRMTAERIAERYARRWSIETTFQECNEHLGLQSPRCRVRNSVLRMTPCLFGLYSLVALLYAAHVQRTGMGTRRAIPSARPWYEKEEPTFVDALAMVQRQLRERILARALGEAVVLKIPARIREMLIMPMGQAA